VSTFLLSFSRGTLSLNAAIFGSVLLASRFSSNVQVFALMAFAIEWFALFPMLRKHLKRRSLWFHILLTGSMFLVTSGMLFSLTIAFGVLYTIGMLFVTFVCPFWLMWLQRYKKYVRSPAAGLASYLPSFVSLYSHLSLFFLFLFCV